MANSVDGNWKYGAINSDGKIVIPLEYSSLNDCVDGLLVAEKGGMFDINEDGKPNYEKRIRGKFGVIDTMGKTIIPFEYDNIENCSEGLIVAEKGRERADAYDFGKNGKFGALDKTGRTVIPFVYTKLRSFTNGIAIANDGKNPVDSEIPDYGTRYGLIDKSGNVVAPFQYAFLQSFVDGLAVATIPYEYRYDNVVSKIPAWGIIDTKGNAVVPFKDGHEPGGYERIGRWQWSPESECGVFIVYGENSDYNGIMGVIDGTGAVLLDTIYEGITPIYNNLAMVKKDGKWGIVKFSDASQSAATSAPSAWAMASADKAKAIGLATADLTNGYQEVTTRAEFCRAAVNFLRKYGYDVDNVTPKLFEDTTDKDIGIAAALKITSGTNAAQTEFSPDRRLTREEAATMLKNLMNVIGVEYDTTTVNWKDTKDISSWAAEASSVMYNAKIMGGTSATALVFAPKSPYTHEASISTLVNLWDFVKK